MSDIVENLRNVQAWDRYGCADNIVADAIVEIKRLRALNAKMVKALNGCKICLQNRDQSELEARVLQATKFILSETAK